MKKLMTLAAVGMLIAGIGATTAVNAADTTTGTTTNIRTMFSPEDIRAATREAGWRIQDETLINSPELQDGKWEIEYALSVPDSAQKRELTEAVRFDTVPLSVYAMIAELIRRRGATVFQIAPCIGTDG